VWDIGIQISLKKTLILSVLFHAGLSVLLLSIALSRSTHPFAPQVYQVDLVALPTAPAPPAAVRDVPAMPSPPAQEPPVQEIKKPIEAVQPKGKIKKTLMKPPPKPNRSAAVIPPPKKTKEAVRAKEAVPSAPLSAPTVAKSSEPVSAIPPMDTTVKAKVEGLDPNSSYYINIQRKVEIYWFPPPIESAADFKEAVVTFILYPTGRIADPTIEKSSGNAFFDQAALRAIYEASPLPPFPQGIRDPSLKVHFSFSLMKKS
jgi:periplasmic protein TonB